MKQPIGVKLIAILTGLLGINPIVLYVLLPLSGPRGDVADFVQGELPVTLLNCFSSKDLSWMNPSTAALISHH